MNHDVIYRLYPSVIKIDDKEGAFDKEGKRIEIDEVFVEEQAESIMSEVIKEQWRQTFTTELYKLKIALENRGDLVTVENIIASQPKQVQIAWNNTPTVRRNSPTVASLASAMQYSDEVLDQLFKDANEVVL